MLPVVADEIGYPRGVTADLHTGEVFVCDARRNRILIFDAEGLFSYEIPGGSVFSGPSDVAVDPEGILLVAANREGRPGLVELDFDGLFRRELALTGLPDGVAPPLVVSLALSPGGDRLYALDEANLRLWIAGRDGALLSSVDLAAGLTEQERQDVILGNVDAYGDKVLVAIASDGQVRVFDRDGRRERRVGIKGTAPCRIARPRAAALAANGELLVVDQQRLLILRWNPDTNKCLGEALGLGGGPGGLYFPIDLALDASGRVYVSQSYEGRVQVFGGMSPAAAPR